MTPSTLVVLYFVIGAVSALLVGRGSLGSFVATLLLWPLWLPFATDRAEARAPERDIEREIIAALVAARDAARKTEHAALFSDADAQSTKQSVRRIARRLDGVEAEIARLGAVQPESELHSRQLERLKLIHRADARALEEIRELVQLLVTELTLCCHAATTDPGPLLCELRARVEALAAA